MKHVQLQTKLNIRTRQGEAGSFEGTLPRFFVFIRGPISAPTVISAVSNGTTSAIDQLHFCNLRSRSLLMSLCSQQKTQRPQQILLDLPRFTTVPGGENPISDSTVLIDPIIRDSLNRSGKNVECSPLRRLSARNAMSAWPLVACKAPYCWFC